MTPTRDIRLDPERAPWLHSGSLSRLLDVLDRNGEEARVVGGAVRNTLLGEPVGEIDLATTAVPDEVMRRAEAAGFKPVPTGVEHGTVTVVVDGAPFEVTTLREDIETFGRHARVAFGRSWQHDAERRDFTMNALYAARDGTVYDHVGGLEDLAARRVRFIGDPSRRIAEDYLRILRFFRFHAAYGSGGPPDPAGLAACIEGRAGLESLSRERVRMEILKLLTATHAVPALVSMSETGLLLAVLGGVPLLASFANMIKLERELSMVPDAIRRLGALVVTTTEDAERLRERLRLANAEYDRLASMAQGWRQISVDTGMHDARALIYRIGPDKFVDRVLLAWSRAWSEGVADARWHELAQLPGRWTAPAFPLKAADFIARGVAKGPALGAAMRAAEEAWIAQDFPMDPDRLARIADAAGGATTGSKRT